MTTVFRDDFTGGSGTMSGRTPDGGGGAYTLDLSGFSLPPPVTLANQPIGGGHLLTSDIYVVTGGGGYPRARSVMGRLADTTYSVEFQVVCTAFKNYIDFVVPQTGIYGNSLNLIDATTNLELLSIWTDHRWNEGEATTSMRVLFHVWLKYGPDNYDNEEGDFVINPASLGVPYTIKAQVTPSGTELFVNGTSRWSTTNRPMSAPDAITLDNTTTSDHLTDAYIEYMVADGMLDTTIVPVFWTDYVDATEEDSIGTLYRASRQSQVVWPLAPPLPVPKALPASVPVVTPRSIVAAPRTDSTVIARDAMTGTAGVTIESRLDDFGHPWSNANNTTTGGSLAQLHLDGAGYMYGAPSSDVWINYAGSTTRLPTPYRFKCRFVIGNTSGIYSLSVSMYHGGDHLYYGLIQNYSGGGTLSQLGIDTAPPTTTYTDSLYVSLTPFVPHTLEIVIQGNVATAADAVVYIDNVQVSALMGRLTNPLVGSWAQNWYIRTNSDTANYPRIGNIEYSVDDPVTFFWTDKQACTEVDS